MKHLLRFNEGSQTDFEDLLDRLQPKMGIEGDKMYYWISKDDFNKFWYNRDNEIQIQEFNKDEINKINNLLHDRDAELLTKTHQSNKDDLFKKMISINPTVAHNNYIMMSKYPDDWYIVQDCGYNDDYYVCDGFEGVLNLLDDSID